MRINYKKLGESCQKYRSDFLKLTQSDVSIDTCLTISSVSMFEKGKSRSADLLLWYIIKGLPVNEILKCLEG